MRYAWPQSIYRDWRPSFMEFTLRDPIDSNPDRIQFVDGWLDSDSDMQQTVCGVAWPGDCDANSEKIIGASQKCRHAASAYRANTVTASEFAAVPVEQDIDSKQSALCYVRVIEKSNRVGRRTKHSGRNFQPRGFAGVHAKASIYLTLVYAVTGRWLVSGVNAGYLGWRDS